MQVHKLTSHIHAYATLYFTMNVSDGIQNWRPIAETLALKLYSVGSL